MNRLTLLALLLGLLLASALIACSGVGDVVEAVSAAGWTAAGVVLAARAVALAVDGTAWSALLPPRGRPSAWLCAGLRFVREAVNNLLPVAGVGGDFVGARLLTFWKVDGATATASAVVDIAVQAVTQLVFAGIGLALLAFLKGDSTLVRVGGLALLVAALGITGFVLAQRGGGGRIVRSIVGRFADPGRGGVAALERVYGALDAIYARPGGIAISALIHLSVWFFGAVEVWVVLGAAGYPVTVAEAIVLESLGQAVKGAAFLIPGAIGAQEGGFIALCALFGIPAGPALALSLVKRVPDLVLGVPGLLTWQALEGRRLFGRRADVVQAARPNGR